MKRSILSFAIALLALTSVVMGTAQAQKIYWHKSGGPLGGAVGDISADSSGRVWISILRDGVWYSDDHGETWDSISRGLPSPNVKYICASNDGYVYAVKLQQDYLFRLNTNKPKDQWIWEDVTPIKGVTNTITDLITTPEAGTIVLATGVADVTISTDHGDSWSPLGTPVDKVNFIARGKNDEYALYRETDRVVYYTTNSGAAWTQLAPVPEDTLGAESLPLFVTKMQIARKGGSQMTIVVGTKKSFSGHPVGGQIYTWDGTKWLNTYRGPVNPEGGKNDDHIDDLVKVKMPGQGTNPDILYASYHGRTLRSSDLGMTWTVQDSIKKGDEPFQLTAEKNDVGETYLYQESEPDGIHRSTDHGVTWVEELNEGLNLHLLYAGGIDTVSDYAKGLPSGSVLYGAIEFGLVSSTDGGATWNGPVEFGHESYTNALCIASDGTPIAGTDAGIFISRDHGQSVEQVANGHNVTSITTVLDNLFHIQYVYASFEDTLLRSSDISNHWQQWEKAPDMVPSDPHAHPWGMDGSVDTLIAGTPEHYYFSKDAGRNWTIMGVPNSGAINPVKMLIHTDGSFLGYLPGSPNTGGGVWRSADAGSNWIKIFPPEGFASPLPTDFYGLNNDSYGSIFVCSDSGLWRSVSQDYSKWENVGGGLYFDGLEYTKMQVNVAEVIEHRSKNAHYAFTRGLSAWISADIRSDVRLPWTSASNNSTIVSYPNPFVSGTTIAFDLKEAAQVHIDILDVMGRIVASVPTAYLNSGKHTVPFEAGSLETGSYMVVLRAGETTQTGWITLTK